MRSTAVNPDRADHHDRRRPGPDRALVEEVVPAAAPVSSKEGPPLRDTRDSLMRHTAVMTVGTTLSRLTGFLRLTAMTAALGVTVSSLGSIYTVANLTPNIVYELILGGILTSVFVPVFVDRMEAKGWDDARVVANRVMTLVLVVLVVVAALGALFAEQIIRLYLISSDLPDREAQVQLGIFFLRWFMPQIVFYGVGAVAIGLLQAHRRFAAPMFAPILNNVVVIGTFVAYAIVRGDRPPRVVGITTAEQTVLAVGTTLGVIAMTIALWPSLRSLGYRLHLRFDWRHEAIRHLVRLAAWVALYVAANQLAYVVIIVLNNRFKAGPQIYTTAFTVFQLPHAIFAVSIFTAHPAGDERAMVGGASRRRTSSRLARTARHRRGDPSCGGRLAGARSAHLAPPVRTRRSDAARLRRDRQDPAGLRHRSPVLLHVPAAHPDLLRDAGHQNAGARERGRGDREHRGSARLHRACWISASQGWRSPTRPRTPSESVSSSCSSGVASGRSAVLASPEPWPRLPSPRSCPPSRPSAWFRRGRFRGQQVCSSQSAQLGVADRGRGAGVRGLGPYPANRRGR